MSTYKLHPNQATSSNQQSSRSDARTGASHHFLSDQGWLVPLLAWCESEWS